MALHTFVAGDVLEAQQLNDSFAAVAGAVKQVKSTAKTDTFTASSTSFVDVTGLSVSITPTSASNKVLILVNINNGMNAASAVSFKLVRDSTAIYIGDASGVLERVSTASSTGAGGFEENSIMFLDSPATTSATTYKIQMSTLNVGYVNRNDDNTYYRSASSITVMEVTP